MYNPVYQITPSLLNSIAAIEAAKAVIENAPLLPLYERQFKSEATLRKVHFSTAIEGNYLKLNEIRDILNNPQLENINNPEYLRSITTSEGDLMIARKRDLHEVINYREVVKYIEKLTDEYKLSTSSTLKHFLLTESIIKDIHSLLLQNIQEQSRGNYRVGTAVSVNFATGEKMYPYEDFGNIAVKMREFMDWFNQSYQQDIHPIIKAGLVHLELVRIHPFEEGNGRLARSLATLSLSIDGYDVKHFFCLDEYYDSNAQDYYYYLGEGFNDPTKWLEYFATGMGIEFNRIKDRVLKISKDAKIKEKAGQMFITERQEQIIEWINERGYFRNQDFDELFHDISEDTVLRELKGLIENNIIVKKGKTKSARYEFK